MDTDHHRYASLRYFDAIVAKPARVTLNQSRAILEGTIGGVNGRQSLVGLTDLHTPLGTYPRAVVKLSDVEYVDVTLSLAEAARLLAIDR
ncbi:hypothetical protein SPRG_10994 [Saprolegnia parasitica CBS 223.65]|uniref:Uncharacterized protein n=1 Tax=Saprolegnia parasitica (strain CBS 223.65) TaxID=695850 RepID=A0A067BW21_SAPPC|nr:hypothetical protein SPRG_10994 [Saprolegnia parasitica CBS 223.65]KDO22679.1 hypothetical protein SPRG_10994 [Saprolegnia parasitica CBS 223.65]|eukprot:XP_012206595.1 hypothetical protein SPRG_10994 [Saprolegnia parasitica CBS 223.65]